MEENREEITEQSIEQNIAVTENGRANLRGRKKYVKSEKQAMLDKGRFQGFIVTFIIMSVIFLIVAAAAVFAYIISTGNYTAFYGKPSETILTSEAERKINRLQAVIEKRYLNDYDNEDLQNGMYKGLMAGLGDPYSVYYTEEEYSKLMEDAEGTFEGIGAYLSQDQDTMAVSVVRPIKDSPAEKVGMKAGDIIVEVDGEDVLGDDINVTVAKIRGKAGTNVKIGVIREGRDGVIRFDIVRASVESESIYSKMLQDSIGYIQITEFDDVTSSQFNKALDELIREEMTGLIIDLRDNGGGNVYTCVEIADRLLKDGTVVYTVEKDGRREEYTSDAENYYDGPLVVLVNGNSASASEILVGALKDYKVGTILGTKTFGKGIVQEVMPLGDGTGMKVTIATYYTPNDVCIHGVGIEPDEELELNVKDYLENDIDNQLDRAVEIIEEQIK